MKLKSFNNKLQYYKGKKVKKTETNFLTKENPTSLNRERKNILD